MPAEIGRQMLGVMDETGTLGYGEVFVQYSPVIAAPGVINLFALCSGEGYLTTKLIVHGENMEFHL